MRTHVLERTQTLSTSLEECWRFFSNPVNLAEITPPDLGFEVRTQDLPASIYAGMLIEYRVRPLWGIALKWITEITQCEAPHFFVDEQRAGPYRLWHHEHFLEEAGEGLVRMRDRVHYALPFGWLDPITHPLIVQPRLESIFAFREKVISRRFGSARLS